MDISYIKEIKHNYMVIAAKKNYDTDYESRMLEENNIRGLLKFHIKYIDEAEYYYYDITSKQMLPEFVQSRKLGCSEIRSIIIGIGRTLDRIEEYLLKENSLYITPEAIYIDVNNNIFLCFIPGEDNDFLKSLGQLIQYMLKHIDHNDTKAVVLAYTLYQKSQKDYYTIYDLISVIRECMDETTIDNESENNSPENAEGTIMYESDFNMHTDQDKYEREKDTFMPSVEKPGIIKPALIYMVSVALGYIMLWLMKGMNGLYIYGIYLALLYAFTAVILIIIFILKVRKDQGT